MINRLMNEHRRFILRDERVAILGDKKPLVKEKMKHLDAEIARLADRVSIIRAQQKELLTALEIIQGADFTIQQMTKKVPGEETLPPEIIALKKLALYTGSPKVRRVYDAEIIRPERIDRFYKGYPDRRPGLFVFSTAPRPAVYHFPLDGIAVDLNPVYEPLTQEMKNER